MQPKMFIPVHAIALQKISWSFADHFNTQAHNRPMRSLPPNKPHFALRDLPDPYLYIPTPLYPVVTMGAEKWE
jgi:hypothetical protein